MNPILQAMLALLQSPPVQAWLAEEEKQLVAAFLAFVTKELPLAEQDLFDLVHELLFRAHMKMLATNQSAASLAMSAKLAEMNARQAVIVPPTPVPA